MLKWKHIRPQNVVYQKHTLWKVAPVQYRSTSSIHREESDHLPGRRMRPQSIIGRIGEDHRKMEGYCDIGGPKYPWPAVNREMKSSRVFLSSGCHRVIELGNDPRIVVLTRTINGSKWYRCMRSMDSRSLGSAAKVGRS